MNFFYRESADVNIFVVYEVCILSFCIGVDDCSGLFTAVLRWQANVGTQGDACFA